MRCSVSTPPSVYIPYVYWRWSRDWASHVWSIFLLHLSPEFYCKQLIKILKVGQNAVMEGDTKVTVLLEMEDPWLKYPYGLRVLGHEAKNMDVEIVEMGTEEILRGASVYEMWDCMANRLWQCTKGHKHISIKRGFIEGVFGMHIHTPWPLHHWWRLLNCFYHHLLSLWMKSWVDPPKRARAQTIKRARVRASNWNYRFEKPATNLCCKSVKC